MHIFTSPELVMQKQPWTGNRKVTLLGLHTYFHGVRVAIVREGTGSVFTADMASIFPMEHNEDAMVSWHKVTPVDAYGRQMRMCDAQDARGKNRFNPLTCEYPATHRARTMSLNNRAVYTDMWVCGQHLEERFIPGVGGKVRTVVRELVHCTDGLHFTKGLYNGGKGKKNKKGEF